MTGHWVASIAVLLGGMTGIWLSRSLPADKTQELGTNFFPLLISLFLCAGAAVSLVGFFLKRDRALAPIQWANRSAGLRIALSLLLFTSYAFALERLGFLLSTFLLLFIFCRMVFGKSWFRSASLASLAVLSSYALLSWALGVRLPASSWFGA